jgi:dihydrofolate reductase
VRIHQWVFSLASFRERLGMEGGETNQNDALVQDIFARTGAYVMGRRMFDEGEVSWPANPPFRVPVFVLTHRPREPWVREGGTTLTFVTDGIESALRQARAAAGAQGRADFRRRKCNPAIRQGEAGRRGVRSSGADRARRGRPAV